MRHSRSMFRSSVVALALASTACSGGSDTQRAGGGDGDPSAASTDVLSLIRQNNDLARDSYNLFCSHCLCGRLVDVSAASEQCQADVIDEFPTIKDAVIAGFQCSIAKAKEKRTCLEAATSCPESEACSSRSDGGSNDCERFAPTDTQAVADLSAALQQRCNK